MSVPSTNLSSYLGSELLTSTGKGKPHPFYIFIINSNLPRRRSVDDITIPSTRGNGVLKRVPEVFDCWFESGRLVDSGTSDKRHSE